MQHAITGFSDNFSLYFIQSENFEVYQLITHMFMHNTEDFSHLFFNMFGLYMFGSAIEQRIGTQKYLLFYLGTGFGAVVLYTFTKVLFFEHYHILEYLSTLQNDMIIHFSDLGIITNDDVKTSLYQVYKDSGIKDNTVIGTKFYQSAYDYLTHRVVGASGALFGLLAAFAMLFPEQKLMLIFFPVPIKAKYFVLVYAGIELFSGLAGIQNDVAHFAHLGGALFGFLIITYWRKTTLL